MDSEEKQPLNEYFLDAILSETNVEIKDTSLTRKLSTMAELCMPTLEQDPTSFDLSYTVPYDKIKDKILDEEMAFTLRCHGWKLNTNKTKVFLTI